MRRGATEAANLDPEHIDVKGGGGRSKRFCLRLGP